MAPPGQLDTLPARYLQWRPRAALEAIDTQAQANYLLRLDARVRRVRAVVAIGLQLTAMAGVWWVWRAWGYAFVSLSLAAAGLLLLCLPIRRLAWMEPATESSAWVLPCLEDVGVFERNDLLALFAETRILLWQAQVAYLLFHPEGQSRLRRGRFLQALADTPPAVERNRL